MESWRRCRFAAQRPSPGSWLLPSTEQQESEISAMAAAPQLAD